MTTLDDLTAAGLTRHDVDAHGTRIHVAEMGGDSGAGPLVLFVHGLAVFLLTAPANFALGDGSDSVQGSEMSAGELGGLGGVC